MPRKKFASTNQKHYPDLGSAFVTLHQFGISALVSQTSFRGETSVSAVFSRYESIVPQGKSIFTASVVRC